MNRQRVGVDRAPRADGVDRAGRAGRRRRAWVIPALLVALALALRLQGIAWDSPLALEEATPFKTAWTMWGWGPLQEFDPNPHFFNYPSLVIYLQFIGQALLYLALRAVGTIDSTLDFRALYVLDKTSFYVSGRLITVLFGVGTVLVTFLTGRRVSGGIAAASAAFLVAVNITHIAKSQLIEVDVPLTCLALLTCLLAVRLLESPSASNHARAAVAAGLATSCKYTGALLLLPIFAAHLLAVRRPGGSSRHQPGPSAAPPRRRAPRIAWAGLGLTLAVFLAALLLTSPYLLLDARNFIAAFDYERLHMQVGHFGVASTGAAWRDYVSMAGGEVLGWPLALAAAGGFVVLTLVRRRRWSIVLAAFSVPYVAAIGSWSMRADRYLLPVVPIAALFAAAWLAEEIGRRFPAAGATGRRRRAALAAAGTLLLALPSLLAHPGRVAAHGGDTRIEARRWIEAHIPPGSFIATEAYGPELLSPLEVQTLEAGLRERVLARPGAVFYAVQQIPMFQVTPEASASFYDARLYEMADLVITSSSVRSRYLAEPSRFRTQIDFYRRLETDFPKRQEFLPEGIGGPLLTLYENPRHALPFAERSQVEFPGADYAPRELLDGTVAFFYYNLGINYESFGFRDAALVAFEHGLENPGQAKNVRVNLWLGTVRCLFAAGRVAEAATVAERAAAAAPDPGERDFWTRFGARLQAARAGSP